MIFKVGNQSNDYKNSNKAVKENFISFGKRTRAEANILLDLTKDTDSLIDIRSRQITEILNDIAKNGDSEDVSLLLDITKNLKFGYSLNSPMADFLNNKSNISYMPQKQNTNWFQMIENTISSALEKNDSPQKAELKAQFEALYPKIKTEAAANANIADNPIFKQQTQLIKLRNKILKSEEFNTMPQGLSAKEIEDFQIDQQRIKRNIDYFMASSESPLPEKVQIFSRLNEMMSPEYVINEQLKDKKVKVLSEILNDLVIKTPQETIPSIKAINQRLHGMCAAISRVRKAAAYEDKAAYVETVMSELDNKPEMKVFDVTNLKSGRKIPVKKVDIDFNALQKEGYRIVDASTLQWMHIAGTTGNGLSVAETYIPYDAKNYGMFNDSKWYNNLSGDALAEQSYLRSLITTRENLRTINEKIITKKLEHEKSYLNYDNNVEQISSVYKKADEILLNSFPKLSNKELRTLTQNILYIENSSDLNLRVHPREADILKKQKIENLIKVSVKDADDAVVKNTAEKIFPIFESFSDVVQELQKSVSLKDKASNYRNLFTLGVNSRVYTERGCDIPETLHCYCRDFKIPTDTELISKRIKELANNLNSAESINSTAQLLKTEANKQSVAQILESLQKEVDVTIPQKVDSVLNILGKGNRQAYLKELYGNVLNFFENQEKGADIQAYLDYYSKELGVKPEKAAIIDTMKKLAQDLDSNIPEKKLNQLMRVLGIDNQLSLVSNAFEACIEYGLKDGELEVIAKNMGVEASQVDVQTGLEKLNKEIKALFARQKQISEQIKVPTAKELVLEKLENNGYILSRKTLDRINLKLNEIDEYEQKVFLAKSQGLKPPSPKDVFKFSDKDISELKKVRNSIPAIKRFVDRDYARYNKSLESKLDELYAQAGRMEGHFWVGEEGSSGMDIREQIRVAEQMTGKHFYAENNLLSAVKKIKETGKSGTSGTNVMYRDFSGHAQYVADIKTMPVANPITGELEQKEVLFHDNSWGARERTKAQYKKDHDTFWKDAAGYERTDYARDALCGGPEGYILDKENLRTGIPVDSLMSDKGINHPEDIDSKALKKLVKYKGESYPIFHDIIIQGQSPKVFKEYNKLMDSVFSVTETPKDLEALIAILQEDPTIKINTHKLEHIEDYAQTVEEKLMQLIDGKKGLPKTAFEKDFLQKLPLNERLKMFGIDSKEVFDEIPENHPLKIILRKKSIYDMPYGELLTDQIAAAKTHQELDSLEDLVVTGVKKCVEIFITTLNKPMEKIKSIKDFGHDIDGYNVDIVTKWIDNKFAPSSDEQLIKKIYELKAMPSEELLKIINDSTRAELGLNISDPYNYIKELRAGNYSAQNSFSKAVFQDVIGSELNIKASGVESLAESAESLYRKLYVASTYVDTKWLDEAKEQALKEYKARPAFLRIPLIDEQLMQETMESRVNFFAQNSRTVSNLKSMIKMEEVYADIEKNINNADFDSKMPISEDLKLLLGKIGKACSEDYPEVKDALAKAMSAESVDSPDFKGFVQLMEALKTSAPESTVNANIQSIIKGINDTAEIMIKSDVQLKHQNDARRATKELIHSLAKDANLESAKNTQAIETFSNIMTKYHVFNRPIEAFHNILNILEHPSADSSIDNRAMENLKYYAQKILHVGNLTDVEHRIIKNIGEGHINKFKDIMSSDSITLLNNKKMKLNSNSALSGILYNLLSPETNNRTLKLFVEAMGLNEEVSSMYIKMFNPQKCADKVIGIIDNTVKYTEGDKHLQKIITDVASQTGGLKTPADVFAAIEQTIAANIVGLPEKELEYVQWYQKAIEKAALKYKDKKYKGDIASFVDKIQEMAYNKVSDKIKAGIETINAHFMDMQDIKEIMDAINLPNESKLYSKHIKYNETLDIAIKKVAKKIEFLNKLL